jgi:hypothetical protein
MSESLCSDKYSPTTSKEAINNLKLIKSQIPDKIMDVKVLRKNVEKHQPNLHKKDLYSCIFAVFYMKRPASRHTF